MIIVYSIYIYRWIGKIIEKIRIGAALALGWPILSVTCSHTIRDNGLFFVKIPIFEGLGLFCIGNMDGSPQVSQSYDWC